MIASNLDSDRTNLNADFEIITEIIKCKERFFHHDEDPRTSSILKQEIAESWVQSRKNGVDPNSDSIGSYLKTNELNALLRKKHDFLRAAIPYVVKYSNLVKDSMSCFLLTDESGTILHIERSKIFDSFLKTINTHVGSIWTEENAGTTCTVLCIKHKKTIQLIGPEHYCFKLQNDLTTSTTIMDDQSNFVGTLTYVQMLDQKMLESIQNIQPLLLGWVTSLGVAIENEMRLAKKSYFFQVTNRTLQLALAEASNGFMIIDKNGIINHLNKTGAELLGISEKLYIGRNCKDINPTLYKVLAEGNPCSGHKIEIIDGGQQRNCVLSINPILGQGIDGQCTDQVGAVIRITPVCNPEINYRERPEAIYTFDDILGESPEIKRAIKITDHVSKTRESSVLFAGETGTGKELFAQALHNSSCPEGPFIAINCASIPRTLIESELFGYEGGAFTGASKKGQQGKIELANGGTLFLDEIGDMPIEIQPVLLRVLEDKRVMRVGGNRYIPVNFRIIAATNQNLYQLVKEKKFREDLYYRITTFKIDIPALRNRDQDVLLLAQHFIDTICQRSNHPKLQLSKKACEILNTYRWPGNVRQLKNAMEYSVSMAEGPIIRACDLPDELINSLPYENPSNPLSMSENERTAIEKALDYTNNNLRETAKVLGIGRATLYRKLREYGLSKS